MGRSLKIDIEDNHIYIKKNKIHKVIILALSIFAEVFFYVSLYQNISTVKDQKRIKGAIILFLVITLIFLTLLILSIRKFFRDRDYKIDIDHDNIIVNGVETFKKNKVEITVVEDGNR